jgi:V-type H+-transporting ATPase subunit E
MADFIRLEAKEKAAEIRAKAAADATLERQNAVRDAKLKLGDDFDRKEKALAVEQRIKASMDEQRQRSRLLAARDDFLQKLGAEAKQRLSSVAATSASSYAKLLKDLVKQALVRLEGEAKAEVHCRPQDLAAAQKAAQQAAAELAAEAQRSVAVSCVADAALGSSSGGVVVWANNGRIKCNNTLEDRLALVTADLTPVVRDIVFPSARAEVRTKPPIHFAHGGSAPAAPAAAAAHAAPVAAAAAARAPVPVAAAAPAAPEGAGAGANPSNAADPFAF